MKLKLIFTCAFCIGILCLGAQAPAWIWSAAAGGTANEYSQDIATDASGNVYVTGAFSSPTLNIGTIVLTNSDPSGTTTDIFLVKYDPAGNPLWAKSFGGYASDWGNKMCTDAGGNIFVTGYFRSTSIAFETTVLTNADQTSTFFFPDIFVSKFDASGNLQWAKRFGGNYEDTGDGISVDLGGNVYITGIFTGQVQFGSTSFSASSGDMFIIKLDGQGNVIWAKTAVGVNRDNGTDCKVDPSGNVVVVGKFISPSLAFGTATLTNTATSDFLFFLVKYDASGNLLWLRQGAIASGIHASAMDIDAAGNTYVTGFFYGPSIGFGPAVTTNSTVTQGQGKFMFLVKYDAVGTPVWVKTAIGESTPLDVKAFATGNVVVAGSFYSNTLTFENTILQNAGTSFNSRDIFLSNYSGSGNITWASRLGGSATDDCTALCIDLQQQLFITGQFDSQSLGFDQDSIVNSNIGPDFFVAKMAAPPVSIGIKKNGPVKTIEIFQIRLHQN